MAIPFHALVRAFHEEEAQFVRIGVSGVNYYAMGGSTIFATRDLDLFLPPDPANLVRAWRACEKQMLELRLSGEPLDMPRDRWLADRVVERRALTRATDGEDLEIDLTLIMAGFEFEEAWQYRTTFQVEGIRIPVARLAHIVASKAAAGRPKDRLFLETHKEALREFLPKEDRGSKNS